jgi:competence protein ComEA
VPETTPAQIALYAVALVAVAVLGLRWLARDDVPPPAAAGSEPRIEVSEDGGGRLFVHVAGAVRRPGVYRLRGGARVVDAVRRAGGATRRGDLAQLNLAAKIEDGRQVLVPPRGPPGAGAATAAGTAAGGGPEAPISLASATVEQLQTIPGIGPATASAILEHRDANGGFSAVEELDQVPGIGPGRLADLSERVVP